MSEPPVVLVSSASQKAPLLHAMRQAVRRLQPAGKVIAGDRNGNAVARYLADDFWLMPQTTDEQLDALLRGCEERGIGAVLPTRDGELAFWARHRDTFGRAGIGVIVSPLLSVQRCLDKLAFARWGRDNALPIIPAVDRIDAIAAARLVVKERFGAGSASLGLNLDRREAVEHATRLDNPIFQPHVTGREISVDAWLDASGTLKGLVMRERTLIVDGESKVTTTFSDAALEARLVPIMEKLDLRGPVVVQALIDDSGNMHIIECNTRFGGASTAALAVGLDPFYWSLMELNGGNVEQLSFERSSHELRQVRIAEDKHFIMGSGQTIRSP